MSSRLDRLVSLLETGSNAQVKRTAARQLGEICLQRPQDVGILLEKICPYLISKAWDTRVACGWAFEEIGAQCKPFNVSDGCIVVVDCPTEALKQQKLQLSTFSLADVLARGDPLLASSGAEFHLDMTGDIKERLSAQKKLLSKRIGLDFAGGGDTGLVHDNDLDDTTEQTKVATANVNIAEQLGMGKQLSARERAAMKRMNAKAKRGAQTVIVGKDGSTDEKTFKEPVKSLRTLESRQDKIQSLSDRTYKIHFGLTSDSPSAVDSNSTRAQVEDSDDGAVVIESDTDQNDDMDFVDEWPFEALCEVLSIHLFDPSWEVRHGAALGLREIIHSHGSQAGFVKTVIVSREEFETILTDEQKKEFLQGKLAPKSIEDLMNVLNNQANQRWLEDISVRLLCVFSLDRFTDFLGDSVVLPVRESCAQTLSVTLSHVTEECAITVLDHGVLPLCTAEKLVGAAKMDDRTLRALGYSGVLALKYFLASQRVDTGDALSKSTVMQVLLDGLASTDDDVRAIVASTLAPVIDTVVPVLKPAIVRKMFRLVWSSLDYIDDLSSSTVSTMDLLAGLVGACNISEYRSGGAHEILSSKDHNSLLAKFRPFFRHTVSSVRSATVKTVSLMLQEFPGMFSQNGYVQLNDLAELLMQNFILESDSAIFACTEALWSQLLMSDVYASVITDFICSNSGSVLLRWFRILVTPVGKNLDTGLLPLSGKYLSAEHMSLDLSAIDSAMITQNFEVIDAEAVLLSRHRATSAVAQLVALSPKNDTLTGLVFTLIDSMAPMENASRILLSYQLAFRFMIAWCEAVVKDFQTVVEALQMYPQRYALYQHFADYAMCAVYDTPSFTIVDSDILLKRLREECIAVLNMFVDNGIEPGAVPPLSTVGSGFSISDVIVIQQSWLSALYQQCTESQAVLSLTTIVTDEELDRRQQFSINYQQKSNGLTESIAAYQGQCNFYQSSVYALAASALTKLGSFLVADKSTGVKPKLNPVIRNIVNAVKSERIEWLQQDHSSVLAHLILILSKVDDSGPKIIIKLLRNFCSFLVCDPVQTFQLASPEWSTPDEICASFVKSTDEEEASPLSATSITRRGAISLLNQLSQRIPAEDRELLKPFRDYVHEGVVLPFVNLDRQSFLTQDSIATLGQGIVNSLEVLDSLLQHLSATYLTEQLITDLWPNVLVFLESSWPAIRSMAARCLSTWCNVCLRKDVKPKVSPFVIVIDKVLPLLSDATHANRRLGAAELVWLLLKQLDVAVLPYMVFLLVPVLGRMSDQHNAVRTIITASFAHMVRLMPLEAATGDPEDLPPKYLAQKETQRKFIVQLLEPSKLEPFEILVPIKAELRKYQQEGVNWLAFLNRYHLHGILCDDMGLGKTLQTICIVASDHFLRRKKYSVSPSFDCQQLPTLIVAPTSVTGHWLHEIKHYVSNLQPILYMGNASDRRKLQANIFNNHDVLITSYDVVRNDLAFFESIHFNYCVLDEGHIIKNAKTKITLAVKKVRAEHRLILSGTPVQNNVLELWSLFDFLMPGFLGDEKQFFERFSKPINAMKGSYVRADKSGSSKKAALSTAKLHERGTLALEALHRQVLPFLMRRMKEDVLHDLPPKIIQDFYCQMSPLQQELYDNFTKSQAQHIISDVDNSDARKSGKHVFQALQYMRKLVNHPAMVVDATDPQQSQTLSRHDATGDKIRNISHAPKLVALRDLLLQCGIGAHADTLDNQATANVSSHRALIFCQLKSMMDFIEHDLFALHMPIVSMMRMDSSTNASKRQSMVAQFNSDPTIDVLLLSTNVGGLGLNLTGADTVIFVEHDWNPMKDLQAMDRAHRLGQKKVVNVYRLITQNTLEEKIMGLQRFKLNLANTIVNQENSGSGLKSMEADDILGLFDQNAGYGSSRAGESQGGPSKKKLRATSGASIGGGADEMLAELDALATQSENQYEKEFDYSSFVKKLQK